MNVETFGNYRFLRKLTVGGMGEIFLAKRLGPEGFEKLVVIKRLLPQFSSDPRFVSTFLNEARLAARLRHPNITQIHDLGKIGDTFFICMEFVDGPNLREFIRAYDTPPGDPIPIPVAVRICAKIFSALDYAHDRAEADGRPLNIVHQDISPPNILLSSEGEVKLTDFGLAKATLWGEETTMGILRGKFPYMAPEHVSGDPQDKLSDLYAAGVILYELLTGVPPFQETGSPLRLLSNIRFEPAPDPRNQREDIPEELIRILFRLLEKEPCKRPQSAREVLSVLERLPQFPLCTERDLAGLILQRTPEATRSGDRQEATLTAALPMREHRSPTPEAAGGTSPPFRNTRGGPRWLLVLLLILFGAGTAAWFFLDGGQPPSSPERTVVSNPPRSTEKDGLPTASGVDEKPAVRIDSPPPVASVTVSYLPATARITWDGIPQETESPFMRNDLEPHRSHLLRLEKEGYTPQEHQLLLGPGDHRDLQVRLHPVPVRLDLISQPEGARIWIDGKPIPGKTPAFALPCTPDRHHRVRLKKDGYQAWETRFQAGNGEQRSIQARLIPLEGSIRIDSTPWTDVYLDGHRLGRTPYLSDRIPAGAHTLKLINRERMIEHEERFRVGHKKTLKKRYRFTGTLDLSGIREGTEIFLNNTRIGTAPLPPRTLPAGNYEVRLTNAEARTERRLWVRVLMNGTSRVQTDAAPR